LFSSNVPFYFAEDELNDFEFWLDGKDKQVLSYSNTKEEYFYVLEDNGKVLACGGFYVHKNKLLSNLVWGMVHAKFHLMGYGSALLNYRIEKAFNLCSDFPITIDTTQLTQAFFEKYGFKGTNTIENYYATGLHRIDMIKINE